MFREVALGLAVGLAVAVASPGAARAQVCCVGTSLATPARLRAFESRALGVELRARAVTGAFDARGGYAAMTPGNAERSFEQSLVGSVRLGRRLQVSARLPFVETSRRAGDLAGWGGGLGDVSVSTRWELVDARERGSWPGLAALAGLSLPTGRAPDEATDALAASATGQGSYEASAGVAVEQVFGRAFVSLTSWVAQRTARTVGGISQSFAPRVTALAAGGYSFDGDLTVGAFALGARQGAAHDQDGPLASSDVRLVTAGLAVALPIGDSTRLQATALADVPWGGWGRNQTAGLGGSATLLVTWL